MISQTAIAKPMCKSCIHIGSDVKRVITQTNICQSPGCPMYFSLDNRLQGEELYSASMKSCSSSRHIAWRNVRMTLTMIRNTSTASQMRAGIPVEPAYHFAGASDRAEALVVDASLRELRPACPGTSCFAS